MITRLVNATARHRHAILLAGVALAAAYATLTALLLPVSVTLVIFVTVTVPLLVLAVVATRRTGHAAFVVRPDLPAFTAPTHAGPVYLALGVMAMAGDRIGTTVRNIHAGDWLWIEVLGAGVYLLSIIVAVRPAWHGYDVYLRPDGLYDRRSLGTLIVPWEAVSTAELHRRPGRATTIVVPPGAFAAHDTDATRDRPGEVRLTYAQPRLVRRRGLTGTAQRITTFHVDERFLAAAIGFYAQHAEYRAAIGTDDGYRRLRQALADGTED
jgi:hypothetical protein